MKWYPVNTVEGFTLAYDEFYPRPVFGHQLLSAFYLACTEYF
jgi:hypothetical protein